MIFLYIMIVFFALLFIFNLVFMFFMLKKDDQAKPKNPKSLSFNEQNQWFVCFDERLRKVESCIAEIFEDMAKRKLYSLSKK